MLKSRPELHWYCAACQQPAVQAIQTDWDIEERCSVYFDKMTKRVETLEAQIKNKVDGQKLKEEVTKVEKKMSNEVKKTYKKK